MGSPLVNIPDYGCYQTEVGLIDFKATKVPQSALNELK